MFRMAFVLMSCLALPAYGQETDATQKQRVFSETPTETRWPRKAQAQYLPNLVRVHERVYSGGLPEGELAFRELRRLGIRTVISVDGQQPDTQAAKKYGMRYVHLPHGYDRVPAERVVELAKAVRDLDGPLYIHCHHGRHRSPAAASVACVAAGLIPRSQSLLVLQIAGTHPNYRGLFQSARQAQPLASETLDRLRVQFREVAEIPPMAEAMVELEHALGRVKKVAAAGWQSPADHPDLSPTHEVLLLREHFTELARAEDTADAATEFRQLLAESEALARRLEESLSVTAEAASRPVSHERSNRLVKEISHACTACHRKFRDNPVAE